MMADLNATKIELKETKSELKITKNQLEIAKGELIAADEKFALDLKIVKEELELTKNELQITKNTLVGLTDTISSTEEKMTDFQRLTASKKDLESYNNNLAVVTKELEDHSKQWKCLGEFLKINMVEKCQYFQDVEKHVVHRENICQAVLDEVRDRIRNFDLTLTLLDEGVHELNELNHMSYVEFDNSKEMIGFPRFDRSDFLRKLKNEYGFMLSDIEEMTSLRLQQNITGC